MQMMYFNTYGTIRGVSLNISCVLGCNTDALTALLGGAAVIQPYPNVILIKVT